MVQQINEIESKFYKEKVTDFVTPSGITTKAVYTPDDIQHIDFKKDIGLPGQYPFTRGHHPEMYRGKLWNIREISGLSTPERFNERLRYLVAHGETALDWICDMTGYYHVEPDQPIAQGVIGNMGVCIHSLKDIETLSQGLSLDKISLALSAEFPDVAQSYLLTAKRGGYDMMQTRAIYGALYYFIPATSPSLSAHLYVDGRYSTAARWGNDFCEYLLRNLPKWNLWYISAYDLREAGATAIQEIAFALSCRDELIRDMLRRGLDIDTIGRSLSPVFSSDRDFFEEIAKMRAARNVWARTMKEKFGATDPRAMTLRFHVDVAGSSMTYQQPLNNIARGAIESLAAVLGGCMGIQLPSYDEPWCIPTEEAVRTAIRTQQIIRHESGVARVADPLAGSYYVEWLTKKIEDEIEALYEKVEQMGGWLATLQSGWIQEQLRRGLIDSQRKVESGEKVVVGVNCFTIPAEEDFKPRIYTPDISDVEQYVAEYKEFKNKRDNRRTKETLENLRHAAEKTDTNLVPYVFECLEADAVFEEILGVLRMVDGLDYDWAGEREYPF